MLVITALHVLVCKLRMRAGIVFLVSLVPRTVPDMYMFNKHLSNEYMNHHQ